MTTDELTKLIGQLRHFATLDPKMQISTVLTLLEVAQADAKGKPIFPRDIEKSLGLQSSSTTRNVYYWEEGHQENTGGHKYVMLKVSTEDRRQRTIHLTPTGRAFINSL